MTVQKLCEGIFCRLLKKLSTNSYDFFGAAGVSLARIHSIFGAGPDNDPDARILTAFLPLQRSSVNSKNSEVISCLGGVLRSPNNITLLMYSSQ